MKSPFHETPAMLSIKRILTIEDDLDYQLILTRYLEMLNVPERAVDTANDLGTGLQLLHEHEYDVVLLDLTLPDSRGLNGLQQLMRLNPTLPVIILTGMEDNQLALEAIGYGAQDYLLKSDFRPDVLERSILHSIERARLLRELNTVKTRLMGAIVQGQEQERQRIAQDIHDGLGQMLAAMSIMVNSLKDKDILPSWAGELPNISGRALREYRAVINSLRPPSLEELGLVGALTEYCHKANEIFTPTIQFACNLKSGSIGRNAESELYRIVQELTNNAIKHSGASHIGIELEATADILQLSVTDNGSGFEVESRDLHWGIGLKNLAVRSQLINASYQIHSNPGTGTAITINIPLIPETQPQ